MNKRPLPPTYLFTAIILIVLLHFFFPVINIIVFPWNLLGIVFLVLGGALNIIADSAFKRHGTTVKPFEESSVLVTEGVFSVSRHPMYLGMALILLGISVLSGALSPFFVVIIYAVLIDRVFISVEERILAEKFSQTWEEYKSKVRRWM